MMLLRVIFIVTTVILSSCSETTCEQYLQNRASEKEIEGECLDDKQGYFYSPQRKDFLTFATITEDMGFTVDSLISLNYGLKKFLNPKFLTDSLKKYRNLPREKRVENGYQKTIIEGNRLKIKKRAHYFELVTDTHIYHASLKKRTLKKVLSFLIKDQSKPICCDTCVYNLNRTVKTEFRPSYTKIIFDTLGTSFTISSNGEMNANLGPDKCLFISLFSDSSSEFIKFGESCPDHGPSAIICE